MLTTKDGMCFTLRYLGISEEEVSRFTFPCWALPHNLPALLTILQRQEKEHSVLHLRHSSNKTAGFVMAGDAPAGTAGKVVSVVPRAVPQGEHRLERSVLGELPQPLGSVKRKVLKWILKPARGAQGKGISVVNSSSLLRFARRRWGVVPIVESHADQLYVVQARQPVTLYDSVYRRVGTLYRRASP